MRFVRFIPRGRFHDCKPRAMPLDLTTIGIGFLMVTVIIIVVTLAFPAWNQDWSRYPTATTRLRPSYPIEALRADQPSEVVTRFLVGRDGRATEIDILNDGGFREQGEAVRETLRSSRYSVAWGRSGREVGLPRPMLITQRFLFDPNRARDAAVPTGVALPFDQVVYSDVSTPPLPDRVTLPDLTARMDWATTPPRSGAPWEGRQYLVHLTITAAGNITFPKIWMSSVGRDTENWKMVKEAVRTLRFEPATLDGRPVCCNITQTVVVPHPQ